ncbi:MAG: glycosyltransferase family 4 protein [Planctomycetota bacterium]
MRLLMLSGDRQSATGVKGPFHHLQREFSRWFERIDVLSPRPDGPVTTRTLMDNVHLHPADCGRSGMRAYLVRRGRELIAEHGHALVVSHDYGWFYNGLAAARISRATGVPYLSEIHHVPGVPVPADLREVFDRFVAKRYVRFAASRAAAFRVVNHEEMPRLLRSWGVPAEKIVVLPSLYIDLEKYRPAPRAKERDVLFVGRLVANKGLPNLVDALHEVRRSRPGLRATFLGKGPLRAKIEKRVERRGLGDAVEFREWVESEDDLVDLYRSSRLLVCASTCEGGPRVTVEAMACGTPAVSTPVGVMPEVLGAGRGGTLCGFDSGSIAEAVASLLSDDRRREAMGEEAREIALRFEYASVIEGYARGLHALVGESAVRRPAANQATNAEVRP